MCSSDRLRGPGRSPGTTPGTASPGTGSRRSALVFADFNGQGKIVENLSVFVEAAKMRAESLDHVLLHGPPGLGKTTLSAIIANELGVGLKMTSGPVLDKPGNPVGRPF